MLNRAVASLIVATAVCAAAAVAVLAGSFALFVLIEPSAGTACAAGAVALGASLMVGFYAFLVAHRARKAEAAQRALANQLQALAGGFAHKHPIAAIFAALAGGVLEAHGPRLMHELMNIAAHFGKRPSSL